MTTLCTFFAISTALSLFSNPPQSARPEVWWHWMNGNVSKEGIVADLDAMASVGLGGVTIFDAGLGDKGNVRFGSEEWFDLIRFAVQQADERNLRVGMANCSGYSAAGGPWITASNAMKTVEWNSCDVTGPSEFNKKLDILPDPHGYCRDIAILAYPIPPAELPTMEMAGVTTTRETRPDGSVVVSFKFSKPYTANRWEATWRCLGWRIDHWATLEARNAKGDWQTICSNKVALVNQIQQVIHPRSYDFDETTAREWRLTFDSHEKSATVSEVRLGKGARISNIANKAYFVCSTESSSHYTANRNETVPLKAIKNLTKNVDKEGKLHWQVPAGEWRIVRVGYAANGRVCHPATEGGVGFESDKFSKAATDLQFNAYIGRICDMLGPKLVGNPNHGFSHILVDSWEAGAQNWSDGLENEFQRRKGYDLTPYLVAFTGAVVEDAITSEKVLKDFREVVGKLFAENFADELAKKCHERGLQLSLEAYGTMPSTPELYGRAEDITMTEFWVQPTIDDRLVRIVTDRAHRSGSNKIIGAEAFTASATFGRWQQDPFSLKAVGDHMYALGVNRVIYHRYAHQPWVPTRFPGMTMGPWGTHYERTETWWYEQQEWLKYQTRSQALLQHGRFIDDHRDGEVLWTHRRDEEGTDIFFVTRNNKTAINFEVRLPSTERTPEIWDAETGEVRAAENWRFENGLTYVTLNFKPSGSTFVVFPKSPTPWLKPAEGNKRELGRTTINGPWKVSFSALYPKVPEPTTFDKLISWSERPEEGIRHLSGSGTYEKILPASMRPAKGERLMLDLGEVKNLATVTVNGKTFPTLWRPPFVIDITDALDDDPKNDIELAVRVTNLWPNRLIGDDKLPSEQRQTFTTFRHWTAKHPLLPSGLLGPVQLIRSVAPQTKPSKTITIEPQNKNATKRIQAALDEVFLAGGGTVVLNAGEYRIGGLRLRSRTTLYLKAGAKLLASRNCADYRVLDDDQLEPINPADVPNETSFWIPAHQRLQQRAWHITHAGSTWNDGILRIYNAEDVAVIGEPGSEIDGCNSYDERGEEHYRGVHGISAHHSRRLTFRGYTIKRTGNWAHQVTDCQDLEFDQLKILAGHDGVHMSSCDRLRIRNSVMKTGDDCIAGFDIRDLSVQRCELNTACSAFRIGGTRINVDGCHCYGPADYLFRGSLTKEEKIAGSDVGQKARHNMLSIFTYYADKTLIIRETPGEIKFKNVRAESTDRLIHYNFSGNEPWQLGSPLASVAFENLTAEEVRMSLCAYGVKEQPISLSMKNSSIKFSKPMSEFIRGAAIDSLSLENVDIKGVKGPLVRSWLGEPTMKIKNLQGVEPKIEKTTIPFKTQPI